MAAQPQLSREEVARREIGRTAISRPLALGVAVAFLLTVVAVPTAETGRRLLQGGGQVPALLAGTPGEVRAVARRGGLLAANRAFESRLSALEDALEEESLVAAAFLPFAQWLQTGLLGVGNERAYLGRDGWLFFRPAVDHLTGPGFLEADALAARARAGEAWEAPTRPDPRPTLFGLAEALASRGIELVVMPVPVKASLHPERFTLRREAPKAPLRNPSFEAFVRELEAGGVRVFDPAAAMMAIGEGAGVPRFLRTDTHWHPRAVEAVARALGSYLREQGLLAPGAVAYRGEPAEVEGVGDLARMLRLPESSGLFPPQRVTVRRVSDPGGQVWRPDPGAGILLLGDSFANVFSTPELGWGEAAGLAEQLSLELQRPVDRLAVNAGGASGARQRLVAALARGEDRLAGKRVVVYELSARELSSGDWTPVELRAGGGTAGRPPGGAVPLGDGFVVWESNRSGDWRIWFKRLDGSGLRRLSPEEPGRQHCCPHVSPDGTRVVYLSRTAGKDRYPEEEVPGELCLINADGSGHRTLVASARTYGWGNRAAVWRNDGELIYVGGDGRTSLLEVASGRSRALTTEPRKELGWLIDATLSYAVTAAPNFSPYDPVRRRVAERQTFGGCEPYFSHDGRWGYWVAAGGGPVHRISLADRRVSTLLARDDPRMPGEKGYVYFPMLSLDGRLFAFAASAGEHDQFHSDYDVFAAPTDPRTLELLGPPVRLTDHPATDRYPDVHPEPLALGHESGEAPVTVRFMAPAPGAEVEWSYGDGSPERAEAGRHTYREAGVYEVTAAAGESLLRGRVVVAPPRPPRVLGAALQGGGRQIVVGFSEPVRLEEPRVTLSSGLAVSGWRLGEGGLTLVVGVAGEVGDAERIRLAGIVDRAEAPNPLEPAWVPVAPPSWPATRDGLAFLWHTADRPNLVVDPEAGLERSFPLTPRGRARLDRRSAMVLGPESAFVVPAAAAVNLFKAARGRAELTVEATVHAGRREIPGLGRILTFGGGPRRINFSLGQRGGELVFSLRTGPGEGPREPVEVSLFPVAAGEPIHLALTYAGGMLRAYRDGEPVLESQAFGGGLTGWQRQRLRFGGAWEGEPAWEGTVEGVALYGRALTAAEVRESHLRYRRFLGGGGEQVPRLEVEATLAAKSRVPTLGEISPYRQALAVYEYRVERSISGPAPPRRIRVAHWVLLDGARQPMAGASPGERRRLVLEPFAANPQLESHFLSDTLEGEEGLPLYYAVEP